jgi:hypothetical protein
VSVVTVADPRQNRFSMRVVVRARQLRDAEWEYAAIPGILEDELKARPSKKTVERWCRPDTTAAKELIRKREWASRKRAQTRKPRSDLTPAMKLAVMVELHERKVSLRSIGHVSAVLWGEELTVYEVEGQLAGKRKYERRKAAA